MPNDKFDSKSFNPQAFKYMVGREIGRASVGKECKAECRSRWSPYH